MATATDKQYIATRFYMKSFLRTNPFRVYGAHAVGIGFKIQGGKKTNQIALRIYTSCKRAESELAAERRVPPEFTCVLPKTNESMTIYTDVIESVPAHIQMPDPESRIRPVPGGVSGSAQSSGTLGAWVWDTMDDSIVMLSNAHVLGYNPGVPIIQPAATDQGQQGTDRIGEVKRSVNVSPVEGPAPWPEEQCNFVDAAIGSADSSEMMDLTVLEVGPAIYITTPAEIDMPVEKMGQSTGYTEGVVVDVDYAAAFDTPIGAGNWQVVGYCDLIRFETSQPGQAVTMSGDSGSIVFTPDPDSVLNPAVGLLAWGADNGSYGVACKIQNVFQELQVDVLCSGGYAAFLDALAEDGQDPEVAFAASIFDPKRPRPARAMRLRNGLARDVQQQLRSSKTGCDIVDFVNRHRAELLSMLLMKGDVRRSVVQALRAILRGATTTDDVFEHILCAEDLKRIELAMAMSEKHSSKELAQDIGQLRRKLEFEKHINSSVRTVVGLL